MIVITKPENAEDFSTTVSQFFKDANLDTCQFSLEQICSTFGKFDAIFVPHYHDKKPAITDNDKEKLFRLVGDDTHVFIEPRNHRTLGVLANKDMSVLIGSDVQDWNNYENSTFAELRLPVGSFSEFLLLAKRDRGVVETLLSRKKPISLTGMPHQTTKIPLTLYPDINILFGPKGTGKTEILKSLYNEMLASGKNCKKYIASENSEDFSYLTNIRDMEADLSKVGASACEDQFKILAKWKDSNPKPFSEYTEWYETRGNSNNKARMKITEAYHDAFEMSQKFESHKNDVDNVRRIENILNNMDLCEYLHPEAVSALKCLISDLKENAYIKRVDDFIDEKASELTNYSIDRIKAIADKNSDTISRPSTAGFVEFTKRRLILFKAVSLILDNLSCEEHNDKVKLGTLEDKGDIFINYKYRMICPEERTEHFPSYNITDLRVLKKELEFIKDHIFDDDVATTLDAFNSKCKEIGIISTKPFLGRSKQIVTVDGHEYTPSNGEKSILLLGHILHEDADAYFLDEPELGMGNSYIDSDIRPLITELAHRRKFVVIATHNANLAVRTLPYMSIFRTHEDGCYSTYTGNPFDDRLVNIYDSTDVRSWTEESMHTLEGGKEAFNESLQIKSQVPNEKLEEEFCKKFCRQKRA